MLTFYPIPAAPDPVSVTMPPADRSYPRIAVEHRRGAAGAVTAALCMEARCQIEQRAIGKGGGDQRNPEGKPVFAKPGRNRNRRQIEQVHEIRIKTEIGIEAER